MSDHVFPEQACYVNCNFCNTPLVGFYIPNLVRCLYDKDISQIWYRSRPTARYITCPSLTDLRDLISLSLFCFSRSISSAKCPETYSWHLAATKFLSLRALSYCHKLVCNEVNVPGNNIFNVVTVRCGLCANLLSVDLEALLGKLPHQSFQNHNPGSLHPHMDCGSSSRCTRLSVMNSVDCVQQQTHPIQPTEKRRVPSAYNKFIKEEIRRLKAKDPDISHKEAFSTAAKNWAHFPEIHFGPSVKGSKQV